MEYLPQGVEFDVTESNTNGAEVIVSFFVPFVVITADTGPGIGVSKEMVAGVRVYRPAYRPYGDDPMISWIKFADYNKGVRVTAGITVLSKEALCSSYARAIEILSEVAKRAYDHRMLSEELKRVGA